MFALFVPLLATILSPVALPTQGVTPIASAAMPLEAKLSPRLTPSQATWVRNEAAALKGVRAQDIPARLNQDLTTGLGERNHADITALAFLVMMQAAKQAQEDLKNIMGSMTGAGGSGRSATDSRVVRATERHNALVTILNGMVEPASRDPDALVRRRQ